MKSWKKFQGCPLKEQNRVYSFQTTGVGGSKLLHKGLGTKYFRLCGQYRLSATPVPLRGCGSETAIDSLRNM